ncbi:subtilase [Pseudomassariella vexata]|uniref:Subtilase n=1 Tax=Pseudomassariella vexata TaxID=1141098 RepID=A0A1Y2DGX2_9PEZI|nr:subtilase [Pseudomassariella vexata]ORY58386.1 subtilase [Pseudomassariella vexata]
MRTASLLSLLPLALAAPSHTKRELPAPVLRPRNAQLVEGKYIVKMYGDTKSEAMESAIQVFTADPDHVYTSNKFNGFASSLSAAEVEALQNDPNVEYIEQNAIMTIKATQQNADWGLARLSSAKPGGTTYTYDESAGEGTCAYVVDTGIDTTHAEFEGRAKWLANYADKDDTDGQGHGTHCAGTIGSKTYGVAKKIKLFAVKVLDSEGSGTNADVIAGMDFVVKDAPGQECPNGIVVNMSLGGEVSTAVNEAAAAIVDAGIFLSVAAGNEAADAKTSSPASEQSACTVGATTVDDELAEYSNFGTLVDILAPGTDIKSTWPGGKTNTISGTSMASPHIAGLAAYFLGLGSAPREPVALCSYIGRSSVQGVISGVPSGTKNLLANNGEGSGGNGTSVAKRRIPRAVSLRDAVASPP